jgi:hypothetical protein
VNVSVLEVAWVVGFAPKRKQTERIAISMIDEQNKLDNADFPVFMSVLRFISLLIDEVNKNIFPCPGIVSASALMFPELLVPARLD